jgi:putative oxidoreductase
LAGGLAVLLGLFTRWAALALAVFCALTAVLFHGNISDGNEFIQFGKNLTMAGGFLALAASGPGRWSLDARRAAA